MPDFTRDIRQPVTGQRGCAAPEIAATREQPPALAEAPGQSVKLFGDPKRKANALIAHLRKHPDQIGRLRSDLEQHYRSRNALQELAYDLAQTEAAGNGTGAAARKLKVRQFELMRTYFRTVADNPETKAGVTKPLDETISEFRLADDTRRIDPRELNSLRLLEPSRKRGGRRKSLWLRDFHLRVLEIVELLELAGEDLEVIFTHIVDELNSAKITTTRSPEHYPEFDTSTIKTWRRKAKASGDHDRILRSSLTKIGEGCDPAALAEQRMSELLFIAKHHR